jgi:hypothetical protein
VLRPRAVRDVPSAELAELRDDRVEVAQRLAYDRSSRQAACPFSSRI